MATAADIRASGFAPGRGKLPASAIAEWDAAHPDDPYEVSPPRVTAAPDYPDDDDVVTVDMPPGGPDSNGDGPAATGETPPRRPPRGGTRARTGGLRNPFSRKKTTGKKPARKPRVSTADLLGSVWRGAAKLAAPLPPLQRTLRVQAPVAGGLLEDSVKGTAIDMMLQPFARAAGTGKTVSALAGPPVIVGGASYYMLQCQQQGREPNPVVMGIMTEALRTSLMAWMDIAGPKFEQALQREVEFEEKYGKSVDAMIDWLFSARPDPSDAAAVEAEEDAIRRAQGIL